MILKLGPSAILIAGTLNFWCLGEDPPTVAYCDATVVPFYYRGGDLEGDDCFPFEFYLFLFTACKLYTWNMSPTAFAKLLPRLASEPFLAE